MNARSFSMRCLLIVVTIVGIALYFVTQHFQGVIATVVVLFWILGHIAQMGFFESWPELKTPRLAKSEKSEKCGGAIADPNDK